MKRAILLLLLVPFVALGDTDNPTDVSGITNDITVLTTNTWTKQEITSAATNRWEAAADTNADQQIEIDATILGVGSNVSATAALLTTQDEQRVSIDAAAAGIVSNITHLGVTITNSGPNTYTAASTSDFTLAEVLVAEPMFTNSPPTREYVDRGDASGSFLLYWYGSITNAPGPANYYLMTNAISGGAEVSNQYNNVTANQYLVSFIAPSNLTPRIAAGQDVSVHYHARHYDQPSDGLTVKPELYVRESDGTETNEIETGEASAWTQVNEGYDAHISVTRDVVLQPDDRLVVKLKVVTQNGTPSVMIYSEGAAASKLEVPAVAGNFVSKAGDTMTGNLTAPEFIGGGSGLSGFPVSLTFVNLDPTNGNLFWAEFGSDVTLTEVLSDSTADLTGNVDVVVRWWTNDMYNYTIWNENIEIGITNSVDDSFVAVAVTNGVQVGVFYDVFSAFDQTNLVRTTIRATTR